MDHFALRFNGYEDLYSVGGASRSVHTVRRTRSNPDVSSTTRAELSQGDTVLSNFLGGSGIEDPFLSRSATPESDSNVSDPGDPSKSRITGSQGDAFVRNFWGPPGLPGLALRETFPTLKDKDYGLDTAVLGTDEEQDREYRLRVRCHRCNRSGVSESRRSVSESQRSTGPVVEEVYECEACSQALLIPSKDDEDSASILDYAALKDPLQMTMKPSKVDDALDGESDISTTDGSSEIFSLDPENSSMTSSPTTGGISNIAADELASLFLQHNEMRTLFEKAMSNDDVGAPIFERKFRSLLNDYALKLTLEARGVDEMPAAALVRRRSRYIARVIRERLEQRSGTSQLSLQDNGKILDRRLQIENYLQGLKGNFDDEIGRARIKPDTEDDDDRKGKPRNKPDAEVDDDSDESEDGWAHDLDGNVPALSAVKKFLIESNAFVDLRANLWDSVEPSMKLTVNSIIAELEAASHSATPVKICTDMADCTLSCCKEPWSNRYKRAVEDFTSAGWDWWPLEQSKPKVLAGCRRLHWKCSCGEDRYGDVPMFYAEQVLRNQKLRLRKRPASHPHSPARDGAISSSSNRGLRPNQLRTPNLFKSMQSDTESGQLSASKVTDEGQSAGVAAKNCVEFGLHVLVNVPVGDHLRMKRIDILDYRDDRFFEQLRAAYTSAKGVFRHIFGIWIYSHCDFFQFEKFDAEGIAPCEPGIPAPENKDYRYNPKPVWKMPPITRHEFKRRFYACSHRRFPAIYNPFHQCWRPCQYSSGAVNRLPKRVRPLETGGDVREIFWGLYVVENLCFYRVAAVHVALFVPSLVFWFLWLFYWGHSGDLQNASVPFLCALGVTSLFWYPLYGSKTNLDRQDGNRRNL